MAEAAALLVDIDVQACEACGGAVKIAAAIEDPAVISKLLDHLEEQGAMPQAWRRLAVRAPPRPERAAPLYH